MEQYSSVEQLLSLVGEKIAGLKRDIEAAQVEMDALKTEGICYAGTWYKGGKYLYLVHPSDGFGDRKREYVGADPEAIQKALAKIERGHTYNKTEQWRNSLRSQLAATTNHLRKAFEERLW